MKVIAQSTAATKLPYLHLAYTAATIRSPQGSILTLGLLTLVIALMLIFKTSKKKTKRGFSATHIVLRKMSAKKRTCCILLLIFAAFLLFLSFYYGTESYKSQMSVHRSHLRSMGTFLNLYHFENGDKFPNPSEWCDQLLQATGDKPEFFQHPGTGPGNKSSDAKISDYAINANLASLKSGDQLPSDVVVLFEAKKGWNQAGGPELVNTELGNKSGCYVLLGNNDVKFVKKEELNTLRWNIEDI